MVFLTPRLCLDHGVARLICGTRTSWPMAKIEILGVKRVVVREGNKERRGTLYIGSGSQESVVPPVCQSQCDDYV